MSRPKRISPGDLVVHGPKGHRTVRRLYRTPFYLTYQQHQSEEGIDYHREEFEANEPMLVLAALVGNDGGDRDLLIMKINGAVGWLRADISPLVRVSEARR